jgi:hypothetical protein
MASVQWARSRAPWAASDGYYKENEKVWIIPEAIRSRVGTLIGVGPVPCGTSENCVMAKFAEPTF